MSRQTRRLAALDLARSRSARRRRAPTSPRGTRTDRSRSAARRPRIAMWPISPAPPCAPWYSLPSTTMPPPTPEPTKTASIESVASTRAELVLAQGGGAHVVLDENRVRGMRRSSSARTAARPSPGWAPWPRPIASCPAGRGRRCRPRLRPRTAGRLRLRGFGGALGQAIEQLQRADRAGRDSAARRASGRCRRVRRRRPAPSCRPGRWPLRARMRGVTRRATVSGWLAADAAEESWAAAS